MFVWINNTDMGLSDIEKWIKIARDDNGGVISPEFAMEILGKTNHLGHIKKVLANIKKNCTTKEEIEPYREFILSCVDGREMSADALKMLHEMATLCGCEKEFKEAKDKPKFYGKFDCNNIDVKVVKSKEELEALEGEDLVVYFDADRVNLFWYDLSKVKALKFREGAVVDLVGAKNLPKDLDVSMCSRVDLGCCDLEGLRLKFREGAEVDLHGSKNLPKDLDFSQCSRVVLWECDLDGLNLKFREGAEVYLGEDFSPAENLPKDLDVSMCSYVDLSHCDLEGLNLKFREGADVNLEGAYNLPKDLDESMCSKVDLSWCDLEGLNLKFREGAEVDLRNAKNLPKDLDVSMCDAVRLSGCDLEGLNLKFKEGAEVNLFGAQNLPKELDISMCSKVDLRGCDLRGVKKIKFKDREQEEKFMEGAKNFRGKVVYADEDKKEKEDKKDNSLFSRIRKRFASGGMGE